ncbi:MAG: metalloregulator ArsR/SmtB family transcription factor [Tepidibacter sp.]|jgi:ArsR family transcriptional regulator|uniref:ArsR/SmtB family transcription factor n=1 Tax=Tepidibacter sp. TaxID=2529387 RepID=UPI0025D6BE8F|nr:metalloregulator ArsR/SmtB family transcription factor [Tepidibacter sp.]MCT4509644.1 metalloregulator ArsR/SmtB family transcription factor [Tepidibacter sp.]
MNLENMQVKILKAMAHPIRLKIIKKLGDQKLCVCELKKDVEFTQSNLSQHLKILKDAGILESEKKGIWMHYRVKNKEILDLINIVENMISDNIKNLNEELGGE